MKKIINHFIGLFMVSKRDSVSITFPLTIQEGYEENDCNRPMNMIHKIYKAGIYIPVDQGWTAEQVDYKTGVTTIYHINSIPVEYQTGNVH